MAEMRRFKRVVKTRPQDVRPDQAPAVPQPPPPRPPSRDEGLVGLLMGMRFDPDNDPSLSCPSCGEEVSIEKGLCPKCHELIRAKDPHSFEARVLPVIDEMNVVYVHLDVMMGELKFVRKTPKETVELQQIRLEDAMRETPGSSCTP